MGLFNMFFSKDPKRLYEQSLKLIEEKRYIKAARNLEIARELNPDSSAICFSLGFCYLQQEEVRDEMELLPLVKKGVDAFQRAIELAEVNGGIDDNQISKACSTVGIFYQRQKDYMRSAEYLEKAMKKNPNNCEIKLFLSTSYLFQGRPDYAEKLALEVLINDPNNKKVLAHWKEIRMKAGKEANVDLPEDKRRKIYKDYMEAKDSYFLSSNSFLGFGLVGFGEMGERIKQAGKESHDKATERMMHEYGLSKWELILIEQEGQEKNWPFKAVAR